MAECSYYNMTANTNELSPKEVVRKLAEQINAHPNAKILVSSPTTSYGEWDYTLCYIQDVSYEPELGFLSDDDLELNDAFWNKDEYFSECGDDPRPEEIPEFNEYIILWCEWRTP